MTHSVGWTFSQNFSYLALPVLDWQCIQGIWTKGWVTESINQSMNDETVYRTAPHTQGLLNINGKYWVNLQCLTLFNPIFCLLI